MIEALPRIAASIVCTTLFCLMTVKMLGAMQQSGYKNKTFLRWLTRKDNLFYNRLSVFALCLALTTAITSLCFSFLGEKAALLVSGAPFLILTALFLIADGKYALKVPYKRTGRTKRLFAVYVLFTACVSYALIAFLNFLAVWNGSALYRLLSYVPFAIMPLLLPFLFCAANAVTGIFENARNKKFVKRAGQVLDESKIIRVGVVGSFGKTSVKNILKTVLSVRYDVVETPESYNTPIGIAKTVFSDGFEKKQVFIAEMGARKKGDIAELCAMVKPDYAVFTGVCEQHISTFKTLENVFAEKSEIIACGAKTVCGADLKERVTAAFGESAENVSFVSANAVSDLQMTAIGTQFTLTLNGEKIAVKTKLLGNAAVENVLLAATLAAKMGLTAAEIEKGLALAEPVPHRLQLIQSGGAYILDDGYNCNPRGAEEALAALCRFGGRKCIVTPGIVECGILEEKINGELGKKIAESNLEKVILVGDTLVGAVKKGYTEAGGDAEKLLCAKTLDEAKTALSAWIGAGDAVLFLNDLPDVF